MQLIMRPLTPQLRCTQLQNKQKAVTTLTQQANGRRLLQEARQPVEMDVELAARAHAIAMGPGLDGYLAASPAVLEATFNAYMSMFSSAGVQMTTLDCATPVHVMCVSRLTCLFRSHQLYSHQFLVTRDACSVADLRKPQCLNLSDKHTLIHLPLLPPQQC